MAGSSSWPTAQTSAPNSNAWRAERAWTDDCTIPYTAPQAVPYDQRLRFRVQVRGQPIEVDMTPEETTYSLLEGRGLLVAHGDEQLRLTPDEPQSRPAAAASEELEPAA